MWPLCAVSIYRAVKEDEENVTVYQPIHYIVSRFSMATLPLAPLSLSLSLSADD